MFNVKNGRKCKIYSESTIKTQERRQWSAKVFSINFALSFHFSLWTCYWVFGLSNWRSHLELLLKKKICSRNIYKIFDKSSWGFFLSSLLTRNLHLKKFRHKHFSKILSSFNLLCCFFSKAVFRRCSVKTVVLQHFAKFTGKYQKQPSF